MGKKRIFLILFAILSPLLLWGDVWAADKRVAAGANHSVSIKSDGTLWAWGLNYYGQLGDGTNASNNTPVQVGTDDRWVSIAAGGCFQT